MKRMKTVIGVCVVCALATGVGAQGAAAAGTTGFTCKPTVLGGAGFSDAHCKTAVASGASFEHVAIPVNVETEGRVTNATTGGSISTAKLKSVQAGVTLELQATSTEGVAVGKNVMVGGEHRIEGRGTIKYSGVTVTAPAGKGCEVTGGTLTTNELRGVSTGMEGRLEPAVGSTFVTFEIKGCSIAALNHVYSITGSVSCPNSGATILCTHTATTAQGTLFMFGQKAGVEVSTTATARAKSTEEFTPVSATTVE